MTPDAHVLVHLVRLITIRKHPLPGDISEPTLAHYSNSLTMLFNIQGSLLLFQLFLFEVYLYSIAALKSYHVEILLSPILGFQSIHCLLQVDHLIL